MLRIVRGLLVFPLLLMGIALAGLQLPAVRERLLQEISQRAAPWHLQLQGWSGLFPWQFHLAHFALADQQGLWVEMKDVDLTWQPSQLLQGRFTISQLTAKTVRLHPRFASSSSLSPLQPLQRMLAQLPPHWPPVVLSALSIDGLEIPQFPSLKLQGKGELEPVHNKLVAELAATLMGPLGTTTVKTQGQLTAKEMKGRVQLHSDRLTASSDYHLTGPHLALTALTLQESTRQLRGQLEGDIETHLLRGELTLDTRDSIGLTQARITFQGHPTLLQWQGELAGHSSPDSPFTLAGQGQWLPQTMGYGMQIQTLQGQWRGLPLILESSVGLHLPSPDELILTSPLRLTVGGVHVQGEGRFKAGELVLDLTGDNSLQSFAALGLNLPLLQGQAQAQIHLEGRLNDLHPSGYLQLRELTPTAGQPWIPGLALAFHARHQGGRLRLEATSQGLGTTRGWIEWPWRISLIPFAMNPGNPSIQGELEVDMTMEPLLTLTGLTDPLIQGRLTGQLAITGSLTTPHLQGPLILADGRLQAMATGTTLTDIQLQLALADSQLVVESGSARDGGSGQLQLSGHGDWLDSQSFVLELLLKEARLLQRDDIQATVSGTLQAKGDRQAIQVGGRLQVDRGQLDIPKAKPAGEKEVLAVEEINRSAAQRRGRKPPSAPISVPTSITPPTPLPPQSPIAPMASVKPSRSASSTSARKPPANKHTRRSPAKTAPEIPSLSLLEKKPSRAIEPPMVTLAVTVEIPSRFHVRGRGLDSEWEGSLHLGGTVENPRIVGTVSARKGYLDLLDRRFTLTRGSLDLVGLVPFQPVLQVEASAKGRDITALARITGPALDPKLELTADPVLPPEEILARLLFDRERSSLSPVQTVRLVMALNELRGGQSFSLTNKARQALGLDTLDVATGDNGGTTVKAGRYLTEDVFLEVNQSGGTTGNQVRVEWELRPHVVLEADTTQNGGSGVGIQWQVDY